MTSSEKEDKLILSRAEDALRLAERNYQIKTVGFLNPHQRSLLLKNIYPTSDVKIEYIGGYDDAERTVMTCRPEYLGLDIDEILKVIQITGRDLKSATHRDYLGSLMGLGIIRENIGDILVTDGGAFVFVKAEIADYIVNNLDKIGRHGVKLRICRCDEAELPRPKTREISGTVSSMRIDSVLSLGLGVSRSKAAELIAQGLVSVNWEVCGSVSDKINERDLISARGYGRIRVESIGGLTRKGRLVIKIAAFE